MITIKVASFNRSNLDEKVLEHIKTLGMPYSISYSKDGNYSVADLWYKNDENDDEFLDKD